MKIIIGITGGIASGKSNVCSVISKLGYEIIDSDLISKELSQKGMPVYNAIIKEFGSSYLDQEGNIDRKKLGFLIFNNSESRERLNNISHPLILEEIKDRIMKSRRNLIFLDIPLLFEAKFTYLCDKIICVYVEKETQIERLMQRDNINYEYALSKINSQMSLEEKKKMSDYVIDSSGTFEQTKEKVYNLLKEIKGEEHGSVN